jgi:hypothetical protein
MAATAIAVQSESTRAPRMTIFDLSRTPEFSHLSVKMAKFVLAYVQTVIDGAADPCAAVKYAYNTKNDESARTLGYGLLGNIKVILVLNRFFGVTPSEAFVKQVEHAMYEKDISVARVDVLKMYCDAYGLERTGVGVVASKARAKNHGHSSTKDASKSATANDTNDSAAPTRFKVGDFCYQDGHKFRVTEIDTDGHPTNADEVSE